MIRLAALDKRGRGRHIVREPLGLPIWPKCAALVWTFVPFQTHPRKRAEDHVFALFGGPCLIRVFDAENELAAMLLGEHVIEETDVCGADVRIARGRGCNANADGFVAHRALS